MIVEHFRTDCCFPRRLIFSMKAAGAFSVARDRCEVQSGNERLTPEACARVPQLEAGSNVRFSTEVCISL
jgi:hypothetical protein